MLVHNQSYAAAAAAAASAKSLQLCQTLCDPIDGSPPGSPSLGFSRQEHWSGLSFPSLIHESEKWKWSHSVMSDSATPWTAAHQAPPSMGFSKQEYWSGLPLPSPTFNIKLEQIQQLFYILFMSQFFKWWVITLVSELLGDKMGKEIKNLIQLSNFNMSQKTCFLIQKHKSKRR